MGIAGRAARAFLGSKLTPLLTLASLALGVMAIMATPREEEPQISVPMIDVMVAMPGASPREIENLLIRPIEQRMWAIDGVDHVYSYSGDGMGLVTVRFRVGLNQEQCVVKVHASLFAGMDQVPPGALPPLVKPHSIDDVPILALTLHAAGYTSNELRAVAARLADDLRTIPDVAETGVIGGAPRQMQIILDPARLAAHGVSPGAVAQALRGAEARLQSGEFASADEVFQVRVEAPLLSAADVGGVVVATREMAPVYLRDVAMVAEGFGERESYVTHTDRTGTITSAVTISLAKRRGANATVVAQAALRRVEESRSRLLPAGIQVEVTRNYGETASDKASELILHLIIATLSVTALIGLFLGWREALVILVAVPVTLSLTLFAYYAMGYSLNRITLFALIFSIGILVDDAIVVVENIYRHMAAARTDPASATVEGVDEVGNPTILATFAVIAAILPMAFVRGMSGPYMRPIPVGASVAMLASLAVAFIVTPYVAVRLLARHVPAAPAGPVADGPVAVRSWFGRRYERVMRRLMGNGRVRWLFYGGIVILLLAAVALLPLNLVSVKMLPFDNKSEFQVILDLPEGTTLERSAALAGAVATSLRREPEIVSADVYAGTAAPFNFNGLVRHYFLRRGANVADVQVTLLPRDQRQRSSHAVAAAVRPTIDSLASLYGASAKIAEIPPGPPVLSTLVAEVYGPTDSLRLAAAIQVKRIFETTAGVVDVDWSLEAPERQVVLRVDRARAAAAGAQPGQIAAAVQLAEGGGREGLTDDPSSHDGVALVPRLGLIDRSSVEGLLGLPVATATGAMPLSRFVSVDSAVREAGRNRRDLRPVIYVTGDVAGAIKSPVYAILTMNRRLDSLRFAGTPLGRYNAIQPVRLDETAIKWDGEWQLTIEMFRDLGIAFAAVLVLIYVLVVGWFQSFRIPLVIMAPIPLTLIGILPGHALTGAFFTATSMIGMIALAGIVVRNSILLVDFIKLEESRGRSLPEAVIEAGSVRFRPIALTAAAVVIGGLVMVLDPIFQGLAVALVSGAVVATVLTMVVVPLLYWEVGRRGHVRST